MTETNAPGSETQFLLVEDDESLCKVLEKFLRKRGYAVLTAGSGEEGLVLLRSHKPALVLLDLGLPGMSGIDFLDVLPQALDTDAVLPVIVITGDANTAMAAACMQRGAMDYLTKPVDLGELEGALAHAMSRRAALVEERDASTWLGQEVRRSHQELQQAYRKLEQLSVATLDALVAALEAKSTYLAGHSARVAEFSAAVARELGLPDGTVEQVRAAGRLHDLGMIGIRESVIDQEGKVSAEDFDHIKTHVAIGVRILAPFPHLGPIVDMVRTHHENWDGSGYPRGLKGKEIPLGGRIIRAAEAYDAVTTWRPYQRVVQPEEAMAHMDSMVGKTLAPDVMGALKTALQRRRTLVFPGEQ